MRMTTTAYYTHRRFEQAGKPNEDGYTDGYTDVYTDNRTEKTDAQTDRVRQ